MSAESVAQLIVMVMGGGIIALIPAIQKWIKQTRDGQKAKEDTAIFRWKEIAADRLAEAERVSLSLNAYKRWYHKLWARYVMHTGDDTSFPVDPAEHEAKKGEKNERRTEDE